VREAGFERRLRLEIERRGGRALKLVAPGRAGVPDRLVLMPGGRVWFVELKAPGRSPRPLQLYRIEELSKLGFRVRVVSNSDELKSFLAEVDRDPGKRLCRGGDAR